MQMPGYGTTDCASKLIEDTAWGLQLDRALAVLSCWVMLVDSCPVWTGPLAIPQS